MSAETDPNPNRTMVRLEAVNVVFGAKPEAALAAMDEGQTREQIRDATGQVLGVHNCSVALRERETLVLMGLSGSGKSTLLRVINALNPVVRGEVFVHDGEREVEITSADAKTLRRLRATRIAMVFQQFALLPWRSVLENVRFGLELSGCSAAEQRERALAQIELVGLQGCAELKVSALSGGMQQRVGLARAFATEAPILLMDEPFSALDPLIRAKLQDDLMEFQRDLKRSIVFVSHDLDEAMKIGSTIAIMEGGRIVQSGSPREILLQPANDYVAEFVSHLNPLLVLCAEDMLVPLAVPEPLPQAVLDVENASDLDRARNGDMGVLCARPQTRVKDLMRAQLVAERPVAVAEGNQIIGYLTPEQILHALLREGQDGGKAVRAGEEV